MKFLDRLFGRTETRASTYYGGPSFSLAAGAGGPVQPWQAESLSAVVACVNAIADGLGTLPARVYRVGDAGRVELHDHPVARLVRSPNPHQTWPDWMAQTIASMLLYGNALSVIEMDGAGRPIGLRPVPWQTVAVQLLPSGRLAFDVIAYQTPWGGQGTPRRFLDSEVFYLKDRSDDGYTGRSRISRAAPVLSAALGLQAYSAAIWENGATPSGILSLPPKISPEGKKRLEAHITDTVAGAQNGGRIMMVDSDTTFTPMSVSPEDAEILASRKYGVIEICRLFGVPPPIVQDYSNSTYTNAAQASLWFATNTLAPMARKIEAEFQRSIFTDPSCHLEIDLSGMLRGDYATRWAANVAAVAAGILTVDEIREQEGYGPMPATVTPPRPLPAETAPTTVD